MRSIEFAYWLQGYFEISEDVTEINERRLSIIKAHLSLVFEYDKEPSKFIHWLKGFLDGANHNSLTPELTDKVKKELHSIFKHVIDPSYTNDPKKQNEMNAIHNSSNNHLFSKEEGVRC
jgi:hypothetical protein